MLCHVAIAKFLFLRMLWRCRSFVSSAVLPAYLRPTFLWRQTKRKHFPHAPNNAALRQSVCRRPWEVKDSTDRLYLGVRTAHVRTLPHFPTTIARTVDEAWRGRVNKRTCEGNRARNWTVLGCGEMRERRQMVAELRKQLCCWWMKFEDLSKGCCNRDTFWIFKFFLSM